MNPAEFWKNFRLGEELSISGAFIYNGLRRFYELRKLDHPDEIFEVLYNLSVGIERLLKIAVVLLEHADSQDQEALEQSLRTHNHLELLRRIRGHCRINLASPHNELLALLGTFYKSHRYDRFSMSSITDLEKEKDALFSYVGKHLNVDIPVSDSLFGTPNDARYKKFLHRIVQTICRALYDVVRLRASYLNLYTYELRHGSKAETIFLGDADIPAENVLWKELLLFFMNTKSSSGYLDFLRSIEPLDFDPELVDEYLDCFQSDAAKSLVIGELESHYEDVADKGKRLELIEVIGSPGVYFDDPDEEESLD
ncbi:hypothetical protein GCM10007160_24220 [Litchfieldella qijiaojingensis]|uniref:Uncharacterized protein n=1 Tax=Litchfieldella qijiaojingensis TaxID=980347 RepID=A0ABQ2YY39_9GAMM|nr:hypothetical protein [Halomonas qijiaojingensis]GGX95755.1 hypothetical protein GCM10007160_24220 [Halomonas qijiaojingensis]